MLYMEVIWYLVIGASVMFYIILDGFDLGVGALHLFARDDTERRIMLNSIGPIWDGNEVWLIIIGGAMFAGFPEAYAILCSAFYTPIMILLCGIIFRAVAIEFRSKVETKRWRHIWDIVFSVGSLIIAFCIGVLLANLIIGIPLDANHVYTGHFWEFFTPYTILLGITGISVFMMHGSIFLLMKTEGKFHDHIRQWVPRTIIFFLICYFLMTTATLVWNRHMIDMMRDYPYLFLLPICAFIAFANIPREIRKGNDGWAFLSSCTTLIFLFSLYMVGTFPYFIRSSTDIAYSIDLYNSAASFETFKVLFIITAIGIPLVIAYGFWIYRVFRGKVHLTEHSY